MNHPASSIRSDDECRRRDQPGIRQAVKLQGGRVADSSSGQRFDWPALTFWLAYFALYSATAWTMLRVGQCVELWCR